MRTYLVSYDLGIPETALDYRKIIDYIKSLGTWTNPLKSEWFVVSDKNIVDIRDSLKTFTDQNDKILVLDVTDNNWATARISKAVTDWMKTNL